MQSKWRYGTFMLFLWELLCSLRLSLCLSPSIARFDVLYAFVKEWEKLLLFCCNRGALHTKNIIFHTGRRVRAIFPKQLQHHFRRRYNNCYMHGRIFIIVICLALHQRARQTQMRSAKKNQRVRAFFFTATSFVGRIIVCFPPLSTR